MSTSTPMTIRFRTLRCAAGKHTLTDILFRLRSAPSYPATRSWLSVNMCMLAVKHPLQVFMYVRFFFFQRVLSKPRSTWGEFSFPIHSCGADRVAKRYILVPVANFKMSGTDELLLRTTLGIWQSVAAMTIGKYIALPHEWP